MSEEIRILIGVPTVRATKILGQSPSTEVRAEVTPPRFSIHFQVQGKVPAVREKLLVAVLSGVHPESLPYPKNASAKETRIDCELVSGEHYDKDAIVLERTGPDDMDALSFTAVDRGRTKKLHLAMTNQSRTKVSGAVVLNKWQAAQMMAALIAIYPQLHED